MRERHIYILSLIFTIIFSLLIYASNGDKTTSKGNNGSMESVESFTCDVCRYAVVVCEKGYDESYNAINYQMLQYCQNLGRYASNCKEISQEYLFKIYSAVHNPSIKNEQICLINALCSDDDDFNNDY
uniref:Saposin B-type domain-containing protein n=1 Tax=Strongyloides papillosus TaxID=174720 RepID=A0A0N5B4W2_STREA